MANGREDLRLVVIHERDFQKYSVDRRIYCVPVCVLFPSRSVVLFPGRKHAWQQSTIFSRVFYADCMLLDLGTKYVLVFP